MRWPSFQQNFDRKFEQVALFLEEFVHSLPANRTRPVVNKFVDLFRPYLGALGIRIRELSGDQVEIFLPAKPRNLNSEGLLDEGAILSASIFAFRLLWKRNSPKGHFSIKINSARFVRVKEKKTDLVLRWEIPALQREATYAELMSLKQVKFSSVVLGFDLSGMVHTEVEIEALLSHQEMLEWK